MQPSILEPASATATAWTFAVSAHRAQMYGPCMQVDRAAATALVSDLTSCLVMAQPGLSCPLAAQLITASKPRRHPHIHTSPLRSLRQAWRGMSAHVGLARHAWMAYR